MSPKQSRKGVGGETHDIFKRVGRGREEGVLMISHLVVTGPITSQGGDKIPIDSFEHQDAMIFGEVVFH